MSGKITTKAVFQSKVSNFEVQDCVIEKVARLSGVEFDRFAANMLKDQDFIRDNNDILRVDAEGAAHCLLVVGEGRRDGVLVNSEGYDYARHAAFLSNVEEFLLAAKYPSLAEFNRKIAAVVDYVDECIDESAREVGHEEFHQKFGLRADKRVIDVVFDTIYERFNGIGFSTDGGDIWFGEDTALIVGDEPLEGGAVFKVEIANRFDSAEWSAVNLPATPTELQAAFDHIGVDGTEERPCRIAAIVSPFAEVVTRLRGGNNLDELNLLASYMRDAEDFQLDNFKAILESGLGNIPQNAAGLINLLYEDNLNNFDVIDASNDEQLGRYWDEERPERFSCEQYGQMVRNEEGGVFTGRGYVYVRFHEFTEYYKGVVPEEYRVVDAAMRGLRAKAVGRGEVALESDVPQPQHTAQSQTVSQVTEKFVTERSDGYTSVLAAIEKGKTAPKPPRKRNRVKCADAQL
ncbi:hypothetical protein FACS189490_03920 [Clostridia bacterium]|nr:hypothetical protein FACS189490_03920 [Clostridia bacterium]